MKTLIIYTSQTGTAAQAVELLAGMSAESIKTINLRKEKFKEELKEYDNVIIGGSIRAGKIQKEIRQFCQDHLSSLENKKVGLFFCALTPTGKNQQYFGDNFPAELLAKVHAKMDFGGILDYSKLNFIEKMIMRMITKSKNNIYYLSEERIKTFAKEMGLVNNL